MLHRCLHRVLPQIKDRVGLVQHQEIDWIGRLLGRVGKKLAVVGLARPDTWRMPALSNRGWASPFSAVPSRASFGPGGGETALTLQKDTAAAVYRPGQNV